MNGNETTLGALIPSNLAEAIDALATNDYTVFAGGTDLSVRYKTSAGAPVAYPHSLLIISRLTELKKIEKKDICLEIGACATYADILANADVPNILKSAVLSIGGPAIRNMGTIGGNICNGSPAGDSLPPLYALDAVVRLEKKGEAREMPLSEFITGPGKTLRERDELLTLIRIPSLPADTAAAFRKTGMRRSMTISKCSVAAVRIGPATAPKEIRIAFGAVGPRVVRNLEAERKLLALAQKKKGKLTADDFLTLYDSAISPIDDQRSTAEYRKRTVITVAWEMITTLK